MIGYALAFGFAALGLALVLNLWRLLKGPGEADRILALDERGILLLIKADPKGFQLLDQRKVAAEDTWAHLAVCGEEVFVRELRALSVFRWRLAKVNASL